MSSLGTIPLINLGFSLLPAIVVVLILYRWSLNTKTALYALARMLIQLLLVGYVLTHIFQADNPAVVIGVLCVMLIAASWISLRPIEGRRRAVYLTALTSISLGGLLTLALVTQGVLRLKTWYQPSVVIPLAGMIFANSMNALSLAAERFQAETKAGADYLQARNRALNASLIPLINSLFAVGLVSFPGMMTGMILSGSEPLVAVRYQIMVMSMIFGSAGISAACFLFLQRPKATAAPSARYTEP